MLDSEPALNFRIAMPDNLDKVCFLISPIGEDESDERKRADGVKKAIVEPAAAEHELTVVRADDVSEPGTITTQIVEYLVGSRAVIADLTDGNPNVFYELAVRDAAGKGAVLIAQRDTVLPFDKAQSRAIFFDSEDLSSAWDAKQELADFLGASMEGRVDNPIASAMVWENYSKSGKPVEEAVAQLAEQVSQIAADVKGLARREAFQTPISGFRRSPLFQPSEVPRPGEVIPAEGEISIHDLPEDVQNAFRQMALKAQMASGQEAPLEFPAGEDR